MYMYSFQFKTISGDDVDCLINPNPPGDENHLMVAKSKDQPDVTMTLTDDEVIKFIEGWMGIYGLFKCKSHLNYHKDIQGK